MYIFFGNFQRISTRSNWFNMMVYGNGVHILGYVLVTAWVSSFLSKFAPSKRIRLVDEAEH